MWTSVGCESTGEAPTLVSNPVPSPSPTYPSAPSERVLSARSTDVPR